MSNIKNKVMTAAAFGIGFLAYNIILFIIAGFKGHEAPFWISWVFTFVAFVVGISVISILGQRGAILRDWLFGYPIIKHVFIYMILQIVISTLFMILEDDASWQLAFIIQFIVLCLYTVLIVSCFIAKNTIEQIETKVADKTRFIKLLRADAEMMCERCSDPVTKAECLKLAEAIRYSDPMSNEMLFELENQIALAVTSCNNAIVAGNFEGARHFCQKADMLLKERNKKCMILKR